MSELLKEAQSYWNMYNANPIETIAGAKRTIERTENLIAQSDQYLQQLNRQEQREFDCERLALQHEQHAAHSAKTVGEYMRDAKLPFFEGYGRVLMPLTMNICVNSTARKCLAVVLTDTTIVYEIAKNSPNVVLATAGLSFYAVTVNAVSARRELSKLKK